MNAIVVHQYGGPDVLEFEDSLIRLRARVRCWCGSPPRA